MKTIIMFVALVTGLLGEPATLSQPLETPGNFDLSRGTSSSSLFIAGGAKADVTITTKYDILWSADNAAGKLLSVNGITQIIQVPLTGNPNIWLARQKAPEKPEEIVVHVWTADGKKWVAKWEEVK